MTAIERAALRARLVEDLHEARCTCGETPCSSGATADADAELSALAAATPGAEDAELLKLVEYAESSMGGMLGPFPSGRLIQHDLAAGIRSLWVERDEALGRLAETQTCVTHLDEQIKVWRSERDAYRAMVVELLASAYPNERDHPTMSKAWKCARALLANGSPSSDESKE